MTTKNTDNFQAACDALSAELTATVETEELPAYMARVEEVMAAARAIKEAHKRELANLASAKSRAKRADRVAKALALLEETEAAEVTA